ncbi:MAG: hypothetical protein RBT16_14165, partial [Desulfococcus multivorans]|nr:hypothetical protein [Desulfococcus multivorans]
WEKNITSPSPGGEGAPKGRMKGVCGETRSQRLSGGAGWGELANPNTKLREFVGVRGLNTTCGGAGPIEKNNNVCGSTT